MPFIIRPFQVEDFHSLWEIDQSCFPPGVSYSQFELKTYIYRSSAFTLVAETSPNEAETRPPSPQSQLFRKEKGAKPEILGFIVGERTPRGRGHIITIDVRAEARRHGLGSLLLESAEQEFRVRECAMVRLETAVDNVAAISFYKRHGYTVIRSIARYYSNGVDALLLEKYLQSHGATDKLLR